MKFTPEIIRFMKQNKGKTNSELSLLVYSQFGVMFTGKQLKNARQRNGLSDKTIIGKKDFPLLSERKDSEGYICIKVSKGSQGWKRKQLWVWEQANDKIPKGYNVIFLDNNKYNFELDNLELVSHHEAMRLSDFGLRFNNKELTKTGLAILKHKQAVYENMTRGMDAKKRKSMLCSFARKQRREKRRENGRSKQA